MCLGDTSLVEVAARDNDQQADGAVAEGVSGLSEQRGRLVLDAVLTAHPTLTTARVEKALAAAAGHPAAVRSLAMALAADPTALAIGAPPMVGQLVEALQAQGLTSRPRRSARSANDKTWS